MTITNNNKYLAYKNDSQQYSKHTNHARILLNGSTTPIETDEKDQHTDCNHHYLWCAKEVVMTPYCCTQSDENDTSDTEEKVEKEEKVFVENHTAAHGGAIS